MAKGKLNFNFHNPNSEDETVKLLTAILAESILNKLKQMLDKNEEIENKETVTIIV